MRSSSTLRAAVAATVVTGLAFLATPARGATAHDATRAPTTATVRGVTSRAISVSGLVSAVGPQEGAEIGAQARLRRANRRGGVAGRRIRYAGTEVDAGDAAQDTASVQRLAASSFAVVPATSTALDTASLARAELPFFGAANSTAWNGNRFGFGFTGAQAPLQTTVVSPSWGVQLRTLLGQAEGNQVVVVVDDDALGTARAAQARTALRAAKFTVAAPIRVAAPPVPTPDVVPLAATAVSGQPAAVLLLAAPSTSAALARQLTVLGYAGTVATTADFYQPTAPALGNGLTVLVPYAPLEQPTKANRQLVADVEAYAAGTQITPAVVAGYWAADQFLSVLAQVGRALTVKRFEAVANGGAFSYAVPETIGTSRWPAMHSRSIPCGALVQSDGSRYFVAAPYRCDAPILVKPAAKRHQGK